MASSESGRVMVTITGCSGARWAAALVAAALSSHANAGNGLYPTGYGAVSSAMAGADIAVARDTTALATNPAGLIQIRDQQIDGYMTVFNTLRTGHADEYGNDTRMSNPWAGIVGGGLAARLEGRPLVLGVGVFIQGGLGYVYEDLNTAFGTRDEISFLLSVAKVAPGFAWRLSDALSVGGALGITYAAGRQKFFPNTSVSDSEQPEASFFGARVDGVEGFGVGGRFGARYAISEALELTAVYATPVTIRLDGGSMTVNYEALDLGRVRYRNASLDGFELPTEIGVGVAWRPTERVLTSVEATWFDWGESLNSLRLVAWDPDGAAPVERIESETNADIGNQLVTSVGVEWTANPRLMLRAGYAYGRRSQPDRTFSPVLPLITEHDLSLGFGYRLNRQWVIDCALEYQPYASVTYSNPQVPFGENARESNEVVFLHVAFARHW